MLCAENKGFCIGVGVVLVVAVVVVVVIFGKKYGLFKSSGSISHSSKNVSNGISSASKKVSSISGSGGNKSGGKDKAVLQQAVLHSALTQPPAVGFIQ